MFSGGCFSTPACTICCVDSQAICKIIRTLQRTSALEKHLFCRGAVVESLVRSYLFSPASIVNLHKQNQSIGSFRCLILKTPATGPASVYKTRLETLLITGRTVLCDPLSLAYAEI